MFNSSDSSHRRLNPLTGEYVLVSPHRTKRPWQGKIEAPDTRVAPTYDPDCYLCPGNKRAGDEVNPDYDGVFVFDNDFAALQRDDNAGVIDDRGLLVGRSERGICRVLCFSPDHSLTLSRMDAGEIRHVVDEWARQFTELANVDFIGHVQIFENRGEMMGSSNSHPHGQIWASESVPNEPRKEFDAQSRYFAEKGTCLLCEYAALELERGERVVIENESFVAVVPFWAVYPYETMILPKRHYASVDQFEGADRDGFASILKRLTTRYDNLFRTPFPYSMGLHQRPTDGSPFEGCHFHAHFYPPLLRSATIRKFLVGFELLGSPQRDITPEWAAGRLREQSELHYMETEINGKG